MWGGVYTYCNDQIVSVVKMQISGLKNHFSDSVRRVQMQILTLKKWFSDSESLLSVKIPLPKKAIFLQCNPPPRKIDIKSARF